jgi:hypothetical protein
LLLVDPATGADHARAPTTLESVYGFVPSGERLYGATDAGLLAGVDVGAGRHDVTNVFPVRHVAALRVSPDERTLLARTHPHADTPSRVLRIDDESGDAHELAAGRFATSWAVDSAFTRFATIERESGVVVRDIATGAVQRVLPRDNARYLFADAALDGIATVDDAGAMVTTFRDGRTVVGAIDFARVPHVHVDVADARYVARYASGVVAIGALDGREFHRAHAVASTLVPQGAVLVLESNELALVSARGVERVPVARAPIAIAPHARGVIALDASGCTEIVEL